MAVSFEQDSHPGKPKILFIGLAQSSHTQAWIDLLENAEFNVRLFAMPAGRGLPPPDWPVRTYVSGINFGKNNATRRYAGLKGGLRLIYNTVVKRVGWSPMNSGAELAEVIKKWKPDIIHTLGLFDEQGGQFYLEVRKKYRLENYGQWVLQLRGGSDMALRRHNPEIREIIQLALSECNQIICDNRANIKYAGELGISFNKFASIVPVPGTGGMELLNEDSEKLSLPSERERIVLWPKAYESQWSKALPVLDAIQLAWERIKPCEIYMLAMSADVYDWYLSMPEEIRKHCHIANRIPRQEVLSLMKRARVLLAPSLVDGVPNSLYEAMASGTFPIISPLETIMPIVNQEENILFARNLYPNEIADALVSAMNDDALIDKAAENNFKLVRIIANRQTIKKNVADYYQELVEELTSE
jgi:glycosyltransferase involved in cell wall biosynthesis